MTEIAAEPIFFRIFRRSQRRVTPVSPNESCKHTRTRARRILRINLIYDKILVNEHTRSHPHFLMKLHVYPLATREV